MIELLLGMSGAAGILMSMIGAAYSRSACESDGLMPLSEALSAGARLPSSSVCGRELVRYGGCVASYGTSSLLYREGLPGSRDFKSASI